MNQDGINEMEGWSNNIDLQVIEFCYSGSEKMTEGEGGLNPQQKRLLEGVYTFYQKGQLTDVTLDVEGQQFACNRNILAASSPFFRYEICT